MPIFRGTGGSGDASTDAYASLIAQYAETAETKADEASASAAAASASETAAETAETNAETAETNAEAAEALAEKWATEAEDVEVETGKFSSFHWAQKALAVAEATAEISDLIDVTITTVADNEVLAYDNGTSEWINQTPAEAGLATAAQGALADTAVQNSEVDADIKTLTLPANTTISTYGASLTDDADAATARTTLGLGTASTEDVTTSATDTTAGRMTKVGDFGQGVPIAGDPNFNNNTVPGTYYIATNSAVNAPFSVNSFGFLQVFERDVSTRLGQLYIDQQTSRVAYRIFVGTWGRWYEIYGQNSLLGTVSQSAGVPTGAVIERGSNANGEYVKFADGTMICSLNDVITSLAITTAWGSLYTSSIQSWTFPATFSTVSHVGADANGADSRIWATRDSPSTTSCAFRAVSASSLTQDTRLTHFAYGRWF